MSFLGEVFGNDTPNPKKESRMGLGEIMGYLTKYIQLFSDTDGNPDKIRDCIAAIIKDFATDENISKFTSHAIRGLDLIQQETGKRYILKMEGIIDNSDMLIQIYTRNPLNHADVQLEQSISLANLQQQHLINLLILIFNGGNNHTGQQRIQFPNNPELPAGQQ